MNKKKQGKKPSLQSKLAAPKQNRSGKSSATKVKSSSVSVRPNKSVHKPQQAKSATHKQPLDKIKVEMIGLTHDGEGVGRAESGLTYFVPYALPGETVEVEVTKLKKQYGHGKLVRIEQASSARKEAPCPIYYDCGGCQLQHLQYEEQLRWKRKHVIDCLTRIGKLSVIGEADNDEAESNEGILVHPTLGMDDPWRYRNKAAVPIGKDGDAARLIGGFYAKGSHRIIDMDDCLIQKDKNDEVIKQVKQIARELRIEPYDEISHTGVLRHVMVRVGVVTGEVMVVLITNTTRLPRQPEWIEHIRKSIPAVKSIVHNINDKVTNAIFGETTHVIWGNEVIYDELDGIRFAISARSFYQVNPEQTVTLYNKALDYAKLTGKERVIDAYCGIGTISLFLARNAEHVYGVEIVPEAIEDAKRNAELNGLTNTTFEAGPAEVVIPRWKKEGIEAYVIVVDPPRKGCDEALLETILAIRPERVVYVSCNPSTLARDLRVLEDGGYKTVEVTPVDMFPHSAHVECCAQIVYVGK